ncbi:MAG TPA: hypothetical protein VGM67_05460 [Gemmatimonadaceae bacterium]
MIARRQPGALLAISFVMLAGCRPVSTIGTSAPAYEPPLISQGVLVPFATLDSAEATDVGNYRFMLPTEVHGRTLQFLADHGATTTMLTDSTVDAAHLPHRYANATKADTLVKDGRGRTTIDPSATVVVVRGDSTFQYWGKFPPQVVDSIRLGTSLQRDIFIATEAPAATLRPAGGLLGRDVLSQFDLEFNLPDRALRVYARTPQSTPLAKPRAPAWLPHGLTAADCIAAPIVPHMGIDSAGMDSSDMAETRQNPGKRIWDEEEVLLPLKVNGHAISGTFDSGSGETIMNWAAAKLLGFSRKSPNVTSMSAGALTLFSFHGQINGDQDTTNYRAAGVTIQLGRRTLPADSVLISDATFTDFDDHLRKPLILVGLRQMRDHILFISYSTGQVCLE